MAHEVLTKSRLWLAEFDFSGDMQAMAMQLATQMLDATTFGPNVTTQVNKGGLLSVSLDHRGLWQAGQDPDAIDEVLFAKFGVTNSVVSHCPQGIEGGVAYTMRATVAEYTPGGQVGTLFPFRVTAQASEGVGQVRGTLLRLATALGASGNGTAYQAGAVPSGQSLYAALHVTKLDGTNPTLDVTIASDDAQGFASPTTRVTFAQLTAPGHQWATPVAGPITDTWWRVSVTVGGTGVDADFAVVMGFK